jgi:hypothetical protein
MNYKSYSGKKKDFDDKAFLYIAKRLFEDLDDSDAVQEKIIDGVGNLLEEPNERNEWAFTSLDRLLLMIRQQIGEANIRQMLQHYEFTQDIDPLFIMERGSDFNYEALREVLGAIVTKVEDKSYLPEYLYHDDNEEYIGDEADDGMLFVDKVRRAFTIAAYLLYGIRNDTMPTETIYEQNVVPSVELTFGVRPWGNYTEVNEFCEAHNLIQYKDVTGEGIRLIVSLAKLFEQGDLLVSGNNRVENQSRNWLKLAKERL